jgi:phosphate transport system protein
MVETAIRRSLHALKYRDAKLAREVIHDDSQINDLRFHIEAESSKLIARQQPMARDLRIIIAVMNIILDLERMGDHAVGIAKMAVQLEDQPTLDSLNNLLKMADLCCEMLRRSLSSFIARDSDMAKSIIREDDQVDMLYTETFKDMVAHMAHDSKLISHGMYLLFAGHNLERIADRVTNICERVIFLNTGRMEEISSGDSNVVLGNK